MKIIDWATGPEIEVILASGTTTVKTRIAKYRYFPETDIEFIAFKHPVSEIIYIGLKFPHFVFVAESFFGFADPTFVCTISFTHSAYTPVRLPAGKTLEDACTLYDQGEMTPNPFLLNSFIGFRKMFGDVFFAGYDAESRGNLPPATIKGITITGDELTLKLEGHSPAETAEMVFKAEVQKINILRASKNGKEVSVDGFAVLPSYSAERVERLKAQK